jgi:hypothetical protein
MASAIELAEWVWCPCSAKYDLSHDENLRLIIDDQYAGHCAVAPEMSFDIMQTPFEAFRGSDGRDWEGSVQSERD